MKSLTYTYTGIIPSTDNSVDSDSLLPSSFCALPKNVCSKCGQGLTAALCVPAGMLYIEVCVSDVFMHAGGYPIGTVRETCFNLQRILPEASPPLTCTAGHVLPLPVGSMQTLHMQTAGSDSAGSDACEAACIADVACIAFTWAGVDSTCMLSMLSGGLAGDASSASSTPSSNRAGSRIGHIGRQLVGPVWWASRTCVHVPRLVGGGGAGAVQVDGAWSFCGVQQVGYF